MTRWIVGATIALLALGVAPAPARPPRTITEADSGKTVVVRRGTEVALRLSGPWIWSEARTRSASVNLTPIEYFVYPGYQQWTVTALRNGRATITATGHRPHAHARSFRITLVVRR